MDILHAINPDANEPKHKAMAEAAYTIGSTQTFQTMLARCGHAVSCRVSREARTLASEAAPQLRRQLLLDNAGITLPHATLDNLDW